MLGHWECGAVLGCWECGAVLGHWECGAVLGHWECGAVLGHWECGAVLGHWECGAVLGHWECGAVLGCWECGAGAAQMAGPSPPALGSPCHNGSAHLIQLTPQLSEQPLLHESGCQVHTQLYMHMYRV